MQLKGELKLSLRKFLKNVELAQKCFYKKNLVAKERNRRVPEDAYIVQTSLEFHVLYLIQNLQYLFEHQRKKSEDQFLGKFLSIKGSYSYRKRLSRPSLFTF